MIDDALRRLGAAGGAPEAHGSLCGLVCFLGARAAPVWMAGLLETVATERRASGPDSGVLDDLAATTCAALDDRDMSFAPLLPPDDRPLAQRAAGLAEWCAGFMHGLGEAASHRAAAAALDAGIMHEIMTDFGEISRLTLGEEEPDLEAETAYTELVEFVRVSVQLVFEELQALRAGPASSASVH